MCFWRIKSSAGLQALRSSTADVSLAADERFVETRRKEGLDWPADRLRTRALIHGAALVAPPVRFLRINDTLIWSAP